MTSRPASPAADSAPPAIPPRRRSRITAVLAALCALAVAAEAVTTPGRPEPLAGWIALQAWLGFGSGVLVILSAYLVRMLALRREDYYDR